MAAKKRYWTIINHNKICRIDSTTKPKLFGDEVTTICGTTLITDGDIERRYTTCKICSADSYSRIIRKSIFDDEYKILLKNIQSKESGEYITLTHNQVKLIELLAECKRTYIYKSGVRTRQLHILGRYINEN